MKRNFFLVVTILWALGLSAQQYPYQNPSLSSEERAKDLISRLTLSEKAQLMCDISDSIPRLGIRTFNWWSEALHGLANNGNVTVFPEPIGMAASFNDELVFKVFNATSDETRAKYHDEKNRGLVNRRFMSLSVWTPNVNIFRDPRWGRGQETYGEDPYLTSRMGISVVKGLQGPSDARYKKLLACAKHYAVHSGPEWNRHVLNLNNVDPRDLWETYLPAFKSLVQEAEVREVMCAYQRLDDEPCCGNTRLLQRILRDDWGFRYMVVSDCGAISDFYVNHKTSSDAVHAASKAVLSGTDVECNFGYTYKQIPAAVEKGLISEQDLDKSLMRLLVGRIDLGDMDNDALVPWSKIPMSVVNSKEHQELALEMARQSMTLLQNKNNILPLAKSVKKIAIIGPNADDEAMLWGNYNGTPNNTITILEGIKSKLPEDKIIYDKGCDIIENMITESVFNDCSINGKTGIRTTYWNNRSYEGTPVVTDYTTKPLQLTTFGQHEFGPGVKLEGFSGKYETVFKPSKSGELVFKLEACGLFKLVVNGDTLSRIWMWRPLRKKVTVNVEKGKEYKIEAVFMQVENWTASVRLNFGWEVPVKYDELIEKLKGIDLVVFAGGISSQLEGEEMPVDFPGFKDGDRTDIELPLVQRNCLNALKQAGKKVILINCSGSAIGLVPEKESCDAILQAWYAGELGGQAIADVLFGDYNPSGKLPITFYKNIQQLPGFEDYSMKGRTYRYMSDPLFPFGFGLSYTSFYIGNVRINNAMIKQGEAIELTIPVTNIGKREGTEIVQVYVRKLNDLDGPIKTLKGFQRVKVAAGKTEQAVISLPYASFEFYDRTSGKMVVTAGDYEISYGNSSDAKDLKKQNIIIQ
jgi:beta-glucosidase